MTCNVISLSMIVSFDTQKSLILIMSRLFFFCCLCFWGQIQKIIAKFSVVMLLPCFLLRDLYLQPIWVVDAF